MKALFYIAGDISNYSVITYRYNNDSQSTFFAAHALYKIFNTDKVVGLLPDSLISFDQNKFTPDQLKEAYKQLIRDRANELKYNSHEIEDFLQKLEIYVIPNTGIGSALELEIKEDNKAVIKRDENNRLKRTSYSENRNPVFIFNVIYSIFKKYHDKGYEIILDLTHGTNVLVGISLALASMFNSKVYAAPVMGPPGTQKEVNIVELTDVIEAMRNSIMIEESIMNVDERYFVDYSSRLKQINPNDMPEFSSILKNIKSHDPGMIKNFLAQLRNGLPVNAVKMLKNLEKNMDEFEDRVNALRDLYEEWYSHSKLSSFNSILLSNFYSALRVKDLMNSIKGNNDLESLNKIIDLYAKVKYYDKFLSLAREYPIAYCMKIKGGGAYETTNEENIEKEQRANKERSTFEECKDKVDEMIAKKISDLIKYRNFIMHSGLSVDTKTQIKNNGEIDQLAKDVDLTKIENSIKSIREEVDAIIKSIENDKK
ncbi:TM1812 family CRISPR-associated protein [Sulfolobus tengchongensis]|uniref:TM1812 family CRISPR-associated protein n=1 Tax=Sulfolobus tengchongensis TaxID=207809 RepID=A0AAX4L394_9CREN